MEVLRMNIKQVTIIISIMGIMLAGALYFKGIKQANTTFSELSEQLENSDKNLRELYLERFAHKEQELQQELATVINVEQWNTDYNALAHEFKLQTFAKPQSGSVDSEVKKLIIEVGKEFNIQPNEFIIKHQQMGASPAAVEECIFYVNEKLLNSYPDDARRFIIGHEFGHMVHHDGARLTTLEQHLDMNNPEHQNLFNKVSRFQEARADIFASTQDMKLAEGGLTFLTELYNRHGDQLAESHPKNSERIEAHKTIVALHNQAATVA